MLNAGEHLGFELGWRLSIGHRIPEGPGYCLELGYRALALRTGSQVLTKGLGVGWIEGAQDPPGDFGVPEVGMGVIGGH